MPRRCSICDHPERKQIDTELVDSVSSFRHIAKLRQLDHCAVFRHAQDHLPATMVQAKKAEVVSHADSLLSKIEEHEATARWWHSEAQKLLQEAEDEDGPGRLGKKSEAIKTGLKANEGWNRSLELCA